MVNNAHNKCSIKNKWLYCICLLGKLLKNLCICKRQYRICKKKISQETDEVVIDSDSWNCGFYILEILSTENIQHTKFVKHE